MALLPSPVVAALLAGLLAAAAAGAAGTARPRRRLQLREPAGDFPAVASAAAGLAATARPSCDAAFLDCLDASACVDCFLELQTRDIDWASVTPDTPCDDVLSFLRDRRLCPDVAQSAPARERFCRTFAACVDWGDGDGDGGEDDAYSDDAYDDDDDGRGDDDAAAEVVDCSKLTECDWPGFHPSFVGNGICNDGLFGCYNTAVCGWDGGDCCQDTCEKESNYLECGHDGYVCRDPASTNCDSRYSANCDRDIVVDNDDDAAAADDAPCPSGATPYRLIMYDSFGDGWDTTQLTVAERGRADAPLYTGSLKRGSQGTHRLCLSRTPACYNVQVKGGSWGNEVSWEVKPMMDAPAIAGGGAPMDCDFPVAGMDGCELTCNGKPNIKPSDDPDYKELKDLFHCIQEKCIIQQGVCDKDEVCRRCFSQDEETQDYCYANDAFNALVDCSLCKCTSKGEESSFCASKLAPGKVYPAPDRQEDKKASSLPDCSPTETLNGGAAVLAFGKCSDIDQVSMMVTDFDENNFGDLDKFESCSHAFASQGKSGSKTALECMQILADAKDGAAADEDGSSKLPKEAIAALAKLLYENAEDFCDCAKKASSDCPLCSSFVHFKTLLYETLDACQSLDEIDCDAWKEFYSPCKSNLESEYGKIDFSRNGQCDFVHNGCGGAGPFPSFRRLDCGAELDDDSWNFYNLFAKDCVDGFDPDKDYKPDPKPVPAPEPAPSGGGSIPAPSPSDSGNKPAPKPYVPPEDRGKPTAASDSDDKTSPETKPKKRRHFHWFWRLIMWTGIVYAAVYIYKRRSDGFNFVRYRRLRHNYNNFDDQDMYSGLSLESSTTFEPPSLPPTPMQL